MRLYLQLALLLFSVTINGQKIVRSSFSSLGGTTTIEGITLSHTVGQPSNTTTISSNSGVIRQGFQQPNDYVSFVMSGTPIDFSLVPNPAINSTTLIIDEDIDNYTVIIETLNGVKLTKYSNLEDMNNHMDLSGFSLGVYIVRIIYDNRIGVRKLIVTYK